MCERSRERREEREREGGEGEEGGVREREVRARGGGEKRVQYRNIGSGGITLARLRVCGWVGVTR